MRKDKSVNAHSYEMAIFKAMRTLLHLIASVHFGYSCYFDWYYVNVPAEISVFGNTFGHKLKYLTFCDALLQTFYFSVALLNDFVGSNENISAKLPLIRRFKDFIFCSLAFPLAMFVGISFWGLWAVDRELVFPRALDEFFPSWLNHVMHTNIMVFIFLEMFLTQRQYPSRKRGVSCLLMLLLVYLVWVHVIYYYSGLWVYPILTVLSWPLKVVFYVGLTTLMLSLYYFGEFANLKVWGKQTSHSKRSGKKKSN